MKLSIYYLEIIWIQYWILVWLYIFILAYILLLCIQSWSSFEFL